MCEILLVYYLAKKAGDMALEKGRGNVPYILMMVFAWIGGEIIGMIVGMILIHGDGDKFFMAYFCALLGAAIGAGATFMIISLLPEAGAEKPRRRRRRPRPRDDDDDRPRRRRPVDDDDDDDDRPRKPRPVDDDDDDDDRPRRRKSDDRFERRE